MIHPARRPSTAGAGRTVVRTGGAPWCVSRNGRRAPGPESPPSNGTARSIDGVRSSARRWAPRRPLAAILWTQRPLARTVELSRAAGRIPDLFRLVRRWDGTACLLRRLDGADGDVPRHLALCRQSVRLRRGCLPALLSAAHGSRDQHCARAAMQAYHRRFGAPRLHCSLFRLGAVSVRSAYARDAAVLRHDGSVRLARPDIWVTLFGPRKGNYSSHFGNDLSLVGNVLLIGGMMVAVLLPRLAARRPARVLAGHWWVYAATAACWPRNSTWMSLDPPHRVFTSASASSCSPLWKEDPDSMDSAIRRFQPGEEVRDGAGRRRTSRLRCPTGSMFGFLGPNGSGKSTTIGCLTGLLDPTAGEVEILGERFTADSAAIKRRMGVMPETLGLFEPLVRARVPGLRGAHVRTGRSHHAQARHRAAGRAGTDRHFQDAVRDTAPACASAWPSPRR